MAIQFEQNTQRKANRLHIPAEVIVLNERMPILNWSTDGFACHVKDIKQLNFLRQFTGKLDFILPTDKEEIRLPVSVVNKWQSSQEMGFEFIDLNASVQQIMNLYCRDHLESNYATSVQLYRQLQTSLQSPPAPKELSPTDKAELNHQFIKNFLIYGLVLLLLAGLSGTYFYVNRFVTVTHKAIVAADTTDIPVKLNGIVDHVFVKPGQDVQAGEPLYSLSQDSINNEITLLKQEINKQKALIALNEVQLKQGQKAKDLYTQAANRERDVWEARQKSLEASTQQLETEKGLFDKANRLGGISRITAAQKDYALQESRAHLEEISKELNFSRQNAHSASKGLYYTSAGIQGNVPELQANIEVQNKALQELHARLAGLQKDKRNYIVRAVSAGRVTEVMPLLNQYANAGTKILTLLPKESPYYIIAVLPTSIETELSPGDPVEIYSPLDGKHWPGKVEHIYVESTPTLIKPELNEVAVKVVINHPLSSAKQNNVAPLSNVLVRVKLDPFKSLLEKLGFNR